MRVMGASSGVWATPKGLKLCTSSDLIKPAPSETDSHRHCSSAQRPPLRSRLCEASLQQSTTFLFQHVVKYNSMRRGFHGTVLNSPDRAFPKEPMLGFAASILAEIGLSSTDC